MKLMAPFQGFQSDGHQCHSATAATTANEQTRHKQSVHDSIAFLFILSPSAEHFHVFVGDLSQNVDNDMLKEAFGKFGEVSFVSFKFSNRIVIFQGSQSDA